MNNKMCPGFMDQLNSKKVHKNQRKYIKEHRKMLLNVQNVEHFSLHSALLCTQPVTEADQSVYIIRGQKSSLLLNDVA